MCVCSGNRAAGMAVTFVLGMAHQDVNKGSGCLLLANTVMSLDMVQRWKKTNDVSVLMDLDPGFWQVASN